MDGGRDAVTGPDLLGFSSLIKIEMMKYWNENCGAGAGGGGLRHVKSAAVWMLFK